MLETEAELDAAAPLGDNLPDGALGHWLGASTGQHRTGWRMGLDQWGCVDLRPLWWEPNDSPLGEDVAVAPGGF